MLYPEVDLYNRGPKDPMFHRKNFLIHYKELLNVSMIREGKDRYMKLLKATQDVLKEVDFNQNILFICTERVQKELFLCGMFTFENLESFYYCNILNIQDIWYGHTKSNNPKISDDDVFYSEQDIKQKVLCLYCDCDTTWDSYNKLDKVVRNVFVSRTAGNRHDGKPQYNWTFFKGVKSQMRRSGGDKIGFDGIIDFYESEGIIIDLNQNMGYMKLVQEVMGKDSNNKVSNKTVEYKGNDELSDIY